MFDGDGGLCVDKSEWQTESVGVVGSENGVKGGYTNADSGWLYRKVGFKVRNSAHEPRTAGNEV